MTSAAVLAVVAVPPAAAESFVAVAPGEECHPALVSDQAAVLRSDLETHDCRQLGQPGDNSAVAHFPACR